MLRKGIPATRQGSCPCKDISIHGKRPSCRGSVDLTGRNVWAAGPERFRGNCAAVTGDATRLREGTCADISEG